jgi:Alginate export
MEGRSNRRSRLLTVMVWLLGIVLSSAHAGAQQADQAVAQNAQAQAVVANASSQSVPQSVSQSPPQAAAQGPVQAAPPKAPPLPNRLNQVMPPWLRVRGEFRDRIEGPNGMNFISGREDLYSLSRFRFDVGVKPSRLFAAQVQLQDARVQKKTVGPTGPPFTDTFDLRMAYADIGDTQKGPFTTRAGRQELAFGEQRLVGHLNWVNAARSFDAVRATVRRKAFRIDGFWSSVVRIQDGFDTSGHGNRFVGAYGSTTALVPKSTVEPYVLWKRDQALKAERGDVGNLSLTTIGGRWVGKLPARFDYGTEMALQTGSLGSDASHAWAGHWVVGNSLGGRWKTRVAEEYNFATGDSNPTDGRRQTFDQLYPTGHDKIGLSDQIGWRNIHDVRSIVELTPHKGWPITASHHSWWLADTHDALYSASGAVVARVPGGAVGGFVGQEVDVQVSHALTPQVQLAAGYAHVFAGEFLKTATPGANYSLPYVMVTYVFLADK